MVSASRPRDAGVARGSEFEDWLQARWANRRGVGGCSKSGHGTVGSEPKWRQLKKAWAEEAAFPPTHGYMQPRHLEVGRQHKKAAAALSTQQPARPPAAAAPGRGSRQFLFFFCVCLFFFCGVCFCLRSLSDRREKWPPGSPWNWVARFRKRWRNGEKEQAQARRAVPVSGGVPVSSGTEQARGVQKRMGTQRGCGQKACQSPRGPWRVWSRQWEEGAARLQAWRRGGAMQHAVGGRAPGGHLAGRGGAAGGQVKALAAHVARRESGSAEGLRGKEGEDAGAQEVSGSGKGNAAQPAPSSRSSCWSARSKGQRRARRGRPPLRPRRRQGPRPRREDAEAKPRGDRQGDEGPVCCTGDLYPREGQERRFHGGARTAGNPGARVWALSQNGPPWMCVLIRKGFVAVLGMLYPQHSPVIHRKPLVTLW